MAEKLGVGAVGADVARLHEELRRRGLEVPSTEVRRQFFGPGTREAVLRCQREHGLQCNGDVDEPTTAVLSGGQPASMARIPITGATAARTLEETAARPALADVDDKTAARLNALPKSLGAFDSTSGYQLFGSVIQREVGTPTHISFKRVPNIRVVAYRDDVRAETALGETTSDAEGMYRIELSPSAWPARTEDRPPASVIVRALDGGGRVIGGSARVDRLAPQTELTVEIGRVDWIVRGVVSSAGRPRPGLMVEAFDRDLRKEQQLGNDVMTDADGRYEIRYTAEQFAAADATAKAAPDLFVRALDADSQTLAESPTRFNASREETIDLVIAVSPLSEWVIISQAVGPLLIGQGTDIVPGPSNKPKNLPPWELNDSDIGFIVDETGLNREQLRLWVLAANEMNQQSSTMSSHLPAFPPAAAVRSSLTVGAGSALLWPLLYGWFRDGQPQQLRDLLRKSNDDLIASTTRAIELNRIPELDPAILEALPAVLTAMRTGLELKASGDAETAVNLGDTLRLMPDADRMQLATATGPGPKLIALLASAPPDDPPSWEARLQAVGDEALLRSAQRSIGLKALTDGFVPWMRKLQQSATMSADPTLADLVEKDTSDWIAFARENGVPKDTIGATDDERFTNYGREMARRIQRLHPTPYIQQRIASDRIPVAADMKGPIAKFLAANPAYRLKETPLLAYRGTATFRAGGLDEESLASVSAELMKIERVATLVPLLDYVAPLLSANYDSGRSIVSRRARDAFVAEMHDAIGDEAHAGQIYDAAADAVANTEALILRHSPRFRGPDLPVIAPDEPTTKVAAFAATTGGASALVLPANLQQLFGNQDYCECAHGASLYGAAAYLADLLQMLSRTPQFKGKTALQVLLARRPDLVEIDLTGDNTDITLSYIDLVLGIIEQPDWEAGVGFRVLRGGTPQNPNNDFDTALGQGTIPPALANDLATWGFTLSEHCTAERSADVQNSAGVTFKSWVIRDQQYGLKLRLVGVVYGAYRLVAFPESVARMPKGYRPWSTLLSTVANRTASARFPWSLPFDVNRDEANAWLEWLGATRENITLTLTSDNPWTNADAACEYLNLNPATRAVLTTAPSAAQPAYQDWGFANATVGAEGIVDPIAGMSGTLGGGVINWSGAETRPADPTNWDALLKNASLLRSRSRLTHRELLNVLEMRFVRAGGARYEVTGAECNSALMRLNSMDAPLARRIHLFVRLWRRLGWTPADLDAAINARSTYTSGTGNAVVLSADGLLFMGNIARLSARGRVPVSVCMDLFSGSTLDTSFYWNHDGAQPLRTLSRYEIWCDNTTLGKPRLPEFRLNETRDALTSVAAPASGLPKVRISDHSTYVAAALGMPESELAALLPVGIASLPPTQVTAAINTATIRIGDVSEIDVEVLIGALSTGASFSVSVQHSDDGATFQNVDTAHLSVANPWPVTAATALLSRFKYSGGKSYLRLSIAPAGGANPSLWMTVRALRTAGLVKDELTLANITALCKYGVLRRLIGKPISDVLTLLQLSGLHPFAATAAPDVALSLLDARDAVVALGLSITQADQLLRGPTGPASDTLEKQAGALLGTARSAHLSILNESTVTLDQRSVLLAKILTDFGWDDGRIADVLSAVHLGLSWGNYVAALDALPAGVNLPASIAYDSNLQRLTASLSVRPAALRAAVAPLLVVATGTFQIALASLDGEAQNREAELALLHTLLREKTPHTFETDWSIPANVPLVIPTEWNGRFYYERALRKLRFVGWMSPADQAALLALGPSLNVSSSTPTFTAAINDLFTQASNYTPASGNALVVRQGSAGLAVETLLLDTLGLQDRCGLILDQLLPDWRRARLRTKLSDALSQGAGTSLETADALLSVLVTVASSGAALTEKSGFDWFATDTRLLPSDPVTETSRAAFPETLDAAAQLLILGQLVTKLALDSSEVPWLRASWSGVDLIQMPTTRVANGRTDLWTSLLALSKLIALKKNRNVGGAALANVWLASQGASIDYAQLAGVLGSTETNLRDVASANGLNISAPAWLRNPLQLAQLVICLDLCREMQIPGALLVSAARAQIASRPLREAESEVQALRQAALGGTSGGNWSDEEKKVLDEIRQRRRDASVDYLVQARQVRDADGLYGYYLIDPQMGPCMMTSRIVQAISSLQLFIQRCFMALEPGVPPAALDKEQWAWMKNYRVWEANRKVLLYPENWIEPELRDDKTPFFDDLVSALQQSDPTSDRAQLAVQTFLETLTDFSRMEIVGTCSSYDESNNLEVTHLFARTLSEPHTYFYRQFRNVDPTHVTNSLGVWTSWQALALDIEGHHLFPVVWQGRLFLFWAIFSTQADEPTEGDLAQAKTTPVPPSKFWALKLAWSEYKSGSWTSRRLAQEDLLNVRIAASKPTPSKRVAADSVDYFYFSTAVHEGGVTISGLYNNDYYSEYEPFTTLFFDGQRAMRASGTYARVSSTATYRFDQSPAQQAEAPVDGSAPDSLKFHFRMAIGSGFAAPLSLPQRSGGPIAVSAKIPRNNRLLYSTRTTAAIFSAPSVFAGFPVADSSVAVPFLVSDRAHQFFVYPTRQLQVSIVQGPIIGGGAPILIYVISEVPNLHFYALDWLQASRLRKTLAVSGIGALLSFESQDSVRHPPVPYFSEYGVPPALVSGSPDGDIEFSPNGASSTYNFELFFHVPFAIACALSKNQRFEEARQWFHYIFDPTDTSDDPSPGRYWRFRPFRESPGLPIEDLIQRLADPTDHSTEKLEFQSLIAQWKEQPFKPHLVARMRLRSYMYVVVMKYLDNLIDWADQLFRRDTMESLNEATQLYVLASQILGRRPEGLPHRTRPTIQSYTELAAPHSDDLTNALVDAENLIPGVPAGGASNPTLHIRSLYFCIPDNPKLVDYYDRVEGQLYKLRNCMNIDGVVRELPLFSPEIDPGLLVKAAAAGIDIASALADLQAPLPLYRFNIMAQKATELCAEVKSLGAALLSAIEKTDAEALARLRSSHEMNLLKVVRLVKEAQLQEAKSNLDALGNQLQAAQTRFAHYVGLVSQIEPLSIPSGPVVGPTIQDLAAAALETLSTATAFAESVTPKIDSYAAASFDTLKQLMARASEALAASLPPEGMDTVLVPMNVAEKHQLDELKSAHDLQNKAADQRLLAQALAMIPDFTLGAQGWASSPVVQFQIGGTLLSKVANFAAGASDSKAGEHSYRATLHAMLAGYQRRAADWLLQAQVASWEIAQIGNQIKASTLRIAIATQELRNHDLQAANALEADDFMRSKFSNQELFTWMSGQLSSLYFQAYQLAYDVAKRAERCFMHELGVDTTFIQFGYWDGLKKGLLAGEMLQADLKRMEVAYLNQNARELEITKHVSLLQLDPLALVKLQETGECEFSVPEVLFDLDFPGHYFRRIKSVSISMPCVAGPYTSLSSTLTLLSSKVRVKSTPANQSYTDEQNFRQSSLPTQSIATSTGQNDSGMFELNFRDERYLPFEGAGVISKWRLAMPQTFRPFDYSTITDVVLHVKYMARDAGGLLKKAANEAMIEGVNAIGTSNSGFNRLFSLRQEFPTEWYRFASSVSGADPKSEEFAISLRRFPFLFTGKDTTLTVKSVALFVVPSADADSPLSPPDSVQLFVPAAATECPPAGDASIGPLLGKTFDTGNLAVAEKDEDAKWKLALPASDVTQFQHDVDDVLLVFNYAVASP